MDPVIANRVRDATQVNATKCPHQVAFHACASTLDVSRELDTGLEAGHCSTLSGKAKMA